MAQVGLKETLTLLAAGYKKKDIDALAAIDEQAAAAPVEEPAAPPVPAPAEDPKEEEPDYKAMYEDLLKQKEEADKKVTALQQENVHTNSAPLAEEARKAQQDSLTSLVRSFM